MSMGHGSWVMGHGPEIGGQWLVGEELYLAALSIDLQWFAAEDEGRTQDPTDITYRKAREEGRVAKSQELIGAIVLLLPAIAIVFLAPSMLRTCAEMLRFFFTRITELDPTTDRLTALIFVNYFLRLILPIMVISLAAALFSNIVQVGWLFTTKPLTPDFSKILPKFGRYFKKIFSVEGLFNFAKSIFKMLIIGIVAFTIVSSRFEELANLQRYDLWNSITLISRLAAQLLVITAVLLLLLSIPDVFFQKWQFKQSLKMTPQKAKEELKQEEGDPDIRRWLKSRFRDILSRGRMLDDVPKADVVITNPTHYSIALEYPMDKDGKPLKNVFAPIVIAKGENDMALKIREKAREHGVPVVSHPPLTRALYSEIEIGDEIPIRYWNVVILVLGKFFSYQQKQDKAIRAAAARAEKMGA